MAVMAAHGPQIETRNGTDYQPLGSLNVKAGQTIWQRVQVRTPSVQPKNFEQLAGVANTADLRQGLSKGYTYTLRTRLARADLALVVYQDQLAAYDRGIVRSTVSASGRLIRRRFRVTGRAGITGILPKSLR